MVPPFRDLRGPQVLYVILLVLSFHYKLYWMELLHPRSTMSTHAL